MSVKPRIRVRAGTSGPMAGRFMGTSMAYDAGRTDSQELSTWNPTLSEANDELGSRDRIVARTRDIDRNDSIATGGVDTKVAATIGAELWCRAKPDWDALGLTQDQGYDIARQMDRVFTEWANDAWFFNDVEGELTFAQQMELAYTHVVREDEAVAVIYGREPGGIRKYATQVRIVDPDLLCNPYSRPDEAYLRNGVETTVDGRPVAYWLQRHHPNASVVDQSRAQQWVRVPRYTRVGRPQVVHYFGKRRAGLKRGVSKLAAGMTRMKQLDRYTKAEINAQLLSAMLPLFIKSKSPATAAEALAPADDGSAITYADARADYHETSKLTFNGVRIPALFQDEELDSVDTRRTGADYEKFQAVALRAIAPVFGLTYEQLSNDWGNVNYSSARAALIEIWRKIDADRSRFVTRFCDPIRMAVIWEAVLRGIIVLPEGAPDFVSNIRHYIRCRWIGPARGWVDPVKEANGAKMRVDSYFTDAEQEAAEQGQDLIENMETTARLAAEAKRLGVPWPPGAAQAAPEDQPEESPGGARQRRAA
jgi:lambda family phage portal protein